MLHLYVDVKGIKQEIFISVFKSPPSLFDVGTYKKS